METAIEKYELELPAEGKRPATPIFARLPAAPQRGVVVIHEIFGRQPEIDAVVERFADRGYAAVAPELLRSGPHLVCLVRAFRAIARGEGPQIDQILATRKWLCEKTGLTLPQIGIIGFCMGGGFALAAGRGWGAVSTNYGDIPGDDALAGLGPVIGCYGGRDRLFGKHGEKLEAKLRPLGIPVETHTFPEAGHAFLTNGHHPIASAISRPFFHVEWNPVIAEQAWSRIFTFFDSHL
jgi:carboxymethylenebutenolidase